MLKPSKETSVSNIMGAINNNTVKTINHFSHNGNPLQETLENRVKDLGYLVSFDGMSIEI